MPAFQFRLGQRIRTARTAKGWTQEELAERTGLTAAFLSYVENGSRGASLDSLVKMAESLGLEPESLLGGPARAGRPPRPMPTLSLEGLSRQNGELMKRLVRALRRRPA